VSKRCFFDLSRDIVRLELRSLFCDTPFENWLRGLPESSHHLSCKLSHLEIQDAYTHLPKQTLTEGWENPELNVDFTENGRGALRYFTGLKRLTIFAGPKYCLRSCSNVNQSNVLVSSAELEDEFVARLVRYFKGVGMNGGRPCKVPEIVFEDILPEMLT
jgi:hypothetical protein